VRPCFAAINQKPQGKTCAAIVGITDEGAEIMEEYKGSPALDAGLLAAAQAVEHLAGCSSEFDGALHSDDLRDACDSRLLVKRLEPVPALGCVG
jgi:hypothetical protein